MDRNLLAVFWFLITPTEKSLLIKRLNVLWRRINFIRQDKYKNQSNN